MKHAVDPLLPNSRTQALKALLSEEAVTIPWWVRWIRALDAAFIPWRAR